MSQITIYTDGAARGNPGPGGYGAVLIAGPHRKELSQGFKHTTNNRMELLSVIVALETLKNAGSSVTVYSDSKYVVESVEKKWVFEWEKKGFKKKTERELKATRKVFSVKGGLSELTNTLYNETGTDKFILGSKDLQINYVDGKYISTLKNSEGKEITIKSNKLITTTGAFELDNFISFVDKKTLAPITSLQYANVVEVVMGFENWDGFKPEGFGGLIPFVENRDVLGVLFMSTLFMNRTPENGTLFTMFIGGMRKSHLFEKSEDELKAIIEKEFMQLLKPSKFNPSLFKLYWHKGAIPQYGIESEGRFNKVKELENKYPGLFFGGNLKDGIGMADRIKQGKELAERAK